MAVAFDAVGPSASGTSATTSPLSWAHNPAAGAALLAGVCLDQATTGTTCTCTFGGVSVPSLGSINVAAANTGFLYVFGLANVTGGSQTVSVTFSGTTDIISAGSISCTGAGSTNVAAFGTFQSATASTGTQTKAFTTTSATSLVVGFNAAGSSSIISQSAGTSRFISSHGSAASCGSSAGGTAPGTGSPVTMTWGTDTGSPFGVGGVEVLAVAAAGGILPQQARHRAPAYFTRISAGHREAVYTR